MREDYGKPEQARIEQYYTQMKTHVSPKGSSQHGHGCKCKPCYEEWAWITGFETIEQVCSCPDYKDKREES